MSIDTKIPEQLIPKEVEFSEMQLSALSEIQNISMGSAATAVSNLLNAKVWITTPKVSIIKYKELKYPNLEPSVFVVINYIQGVHGSNIMILKQTDVQLMLNQLMGMPLVVSEDFVFDELNMSAVCEIMNQMMGSAATALAEFLNVPIDISTPFATLNEQEKDEKINEVHPEDYVVAIHFNLSVDGVINSEFVSIVEIDLAKTLADKMLIGFETEIVSDKIAPEKNEPVAQQKEPDPAYNTPPAESYQHQQPSYDRPPEQQQYQQPMYQQQIYQQPQYQQQMYQQPQYQQPMYQQPMYQQPSKLPDPINVQNIKLHQFESFDAPSLPSDQQDNLHLLMSVPLEVSVEIGKAKKKIKDILEFTQGTVIELDRQAGAPVDVIVNGHLIAKGDVVVIDDNFAVRITEIVKSKFLESLGDKE